MALFDPIVLPSPPPGAIGIARRDITVLDPVRQLAWMRRQDLAHPDPEMRLIYRKAYDYISGKRIDKDLFRLNRQLLAAQIREYRRQLRWQQAELRRVRALIRAAKRARALRFTKVGLVTLAALEVVRRAVFRPVSATAAAAAVTAIRTAGRTFLRVGGNEIVRQQGEALAESALIPASAPPPTPIFTADTQGFGAALQRYWQVVGGDLGALLRQQTKLVVERCIDLTPPFSGKRLTRMLGGGDFGRTSAKKIGEERVRRDIERVFVPVDKLWAWREHEGFRAAIRKNDEQAIRAMLGDKWDLEEIAPLPNPELHRRQRNARGGVVRRPRKQLVTKRGAVEKYVKAAQKNVGYAKAGWNPAARMFGARLPAWIDRHNAPGFAVDNSRSTPMTTRIGNSVPYIQEKGRELRIIELALTGQEKAMLSNIRRILKERAKTRDN